MDRGGEYGLPCLQRVYDMSLVSTSQGFTLTPHMEQPHNLSLTSGTLSQPGDTQAGRSHNGVPGSPPPSAGGEEKVLVKAASDHFWTCLSSRYNCQQKSDCIIVCQDGSIRVDKLLMVAASSYLRRLVLFVERQTAFDEMLTFMMPDVTCAEVDVLVQLLYGVAPRSHKLLSTWILEMLGIDFNIGCDLAEQERIPTDDVDKLHELVVLWKSSAAVEEFPTFISFLIDHFKSQDGAKISTKNLTMTERKGGQKHEVGQDIYNNFKENNTDMKNEAREGSPNTDNLENQSDSQYCENQNQNTDDLDNFARNKVRQKAGHISTCNQDQADVYRCSVPGCDYKSRIKASLFVHGRKTHMSRKYKTSCHCCPKCGEWWSNKDLFNKHKEKEKCDTVCERPFVCEECGRGWFNLTNYTTHIEEEMTKESLDHCSFDPLPAERVSCEFCQEKFYSHNNLTHHIKHAHRGKTATVYECKKCELTWTVHKDWIAHRKAHNSSRIKSKASLNRHEEIHAEAITEDILPKPKGELFYCTQCPKSFTTKGYLNQHTLFKHSDIRAFSCDQCGKKFKSKHCVNIHLRTHGIGGKMWTCERCGKSFKQISSYHQHLHVHSDVREFVCETCSKAFKMKSNLRKHMKLHQKNPTNHVKKKKHTLYLTQQLEPPSQTGQVLVEGGGLTHLRLVEEADDLSPRQTKPDEKLHVLPFSEYSHRGSIHSYRTEQEHKSSLNLSQGSFCGVIQQVMCDLCQWTGTSTDFNQHKKLHTYPNTTIRF